MVDVLNDWVKEHQSEIDEEKERQEKKGQKVKTLKDGENIVALNMKEITESTFEFEQKDGTTNKVKRYFYWYTAQDEYKEESPETHPLLVPKSVHMAIVDNKREYGDKLETVKVINLGS